MIGKVKFYGGKINLVEKCICVCVRVILYVLKDLVLESSNVIIMGYRVFDMDVIGVVIGILKVV